MTRAWQMVMVLLAVFAAIGRADRGIAADADDRSSGFQPAAVLAPFVNDDTFAAAGIHLTALPKEGAGEDGPLRAILSQLGERDPATAGVLKGVEQFVASFVNVLRAADVDSVYAVVGLGDIHEGGGPLLIFHVGPSGQPEKLAETLTSMGSTGPWSGDVEARPHVRDAVLVGTRSTLDRYESLAESERADLLGPLAKLSEEGAVVAGVFCPGPDFRRVVRELWPELPGPLAPLRGELADRWIHLGVAVNRPPDARPRAALQATDSDAADAFVKVLRALPAAAENLTELGERRHELRQYLQAIVDALAPQVEGTRAVLTFPTDEAQVAKLRSVMEQATDAAMESTRRKERIRQFKRLAIALFNYHDVHKHFPASAAIRSAEGKPLLSWRVAILPYVDEGELYKQFHLDEPWDSPHNRQLIEKMPAIYADPDPRIRQLAGAGKTTYQVPVGEETVFYSNEGTSFSEIADGTSKTILIVEVEPSRAVVWTKPKDWEVNIQNPRRGVARNDRDSFVAAWCDGSVQAIPVDVDKAKLRAYLTRAGREIVDRP